jgi:hypothetical protein
VAYRLYLPKEWATDRARRSKAVRGEGHGIAFCKTTPCKVGRAASPETPSSTAAGCSCWPAAPCRSPVTRSPGGETGMEPRPKGANATAGELLPHGLPASSRRSFADQFLQISD